MVPPPTWGENRRAAIAAPPQTARARAIPPIPSHQLSVAAPCDFRARRSSHAWPAGRAGLAEPLSSECAGLRECASAEVDDVTPALAAIGTAEIAKRCGKISLLAPGAKASARVATARMIADRP